MPVFRYTSNYFILISRLVVVVGTVRRLPIGMSRFAMVVMMVMSPLISVVWSGVNIGDDQFGTVFRSFSLMSSMPVLNTGGLVKFFPGLLIISIEAASRF